MYFRRFEVFQWNPLTSSTSKRRVISTYPPCASEQVVVSTQCHIEVPLTVLATLRGEGSCVEMDSRDVVARSGRYLHSGKAMNEASTCDTDLSIHWDLMWHYYYSSMFLIWASIAPFPPIPCKPRLYLNMDDSDLLQTHNILLGSA